MLQCTSQAGTGIERRAPDVRDGIRNRNAGQAPARHKRRASNTGNAIGNYVTTRFAHRTFDERVCALVEQDPINTGIDGIRCLRRYRCQAGAADEFQIPDVDDAAADCDIGQAGAVIERK